MKWWRSPIGWCAASVYTATAIFLILSQGLFGESFIALILGWPWSALLGFASRMFPAQGSPLYLVGLYVQLLVPIMLNAVEFYVVGFWFEKFCRSLRS